MSQAQQRVAVKIFAAIHLKGLVAKIGDCFRSRRETARTLKRSGIAIQTLKELWPSQEFGSSRLHFPCVAFISDEPNMPRKKCLSLGELICGFYRMFQKPGMPDVV
jgi:hypothetical protein